jgi:hypothetical protein
MQKPAKIHDAVAELLFLSPVAALADIRILKGRSVAPKGSK